MRLLSFESLAWLLVASMLVVGCGPGGEQGNVGGSGSGGRGGSSGDGGSGGSGAQGGGAPLLPGDTTGLTAAGELRLDGGVVIGITSDIEPEYIPLLHITKYVNGALVGDEKLTWPITFPLEVPFLDLVAGDEVEVQIEAPNEDPMFGLPPLTQVARTTVVGGKVLLLRVPVSYSCVFSVPCNPSGLCYNGQCLGPQMPPAVLEDYSPDWAKYSYCKPKVAGAPELLLSAGFTSFVPIDDGQVVDLVAGPQGGHHVWIALRMRNLRQVSMVTLTGYAPGLHLDVGPLMYNVTFGEDPLLGRCWANYLTFPVDFAVDYKQFLGQELQIKAQVSDSDGATAEESAVVNISNTVIGQGP